MRKVLRGQARRRGNARGEGEEIRGEKRVYRKDEREEISIRDDVQGGEGREKAGKEERAYRRRGHTPRRAQAKEWRAGN